MRFRTMSPVFLAVAALTCSLAQAAKFSELKVIQEAAQAGTWTIATSGTLPDGKPFPASKRTVCASREEVARSFDSSFMMDSKTGADDKTCPTTLTTNTSTVGVATMTCPAMNIDLPGQKLKIPATTVSTEFKRTGQQTWTAKTGNVLTNITYHGSATANCAANR